MAFNPVLFLKESKTELEKVDWPTRGQTLKLTLVVVLTSIAVGAYIAGLDAIFTKITETFFYK